MNHKFLLVCSFFLLFAAFVAGAINTPWLHTEGKYIKDPNGNTVILRGLSMISVWNMGEREGPRYSYYAHTEEPDINIARIKAMIDLATDETKGWYARVLRFPVYPTQQDSDPGWLDAASLDRYKLLLKTTIDYATTKGVYCIIDWHYIANYGDKLASTQAFWDYIAPAYKSYSNVIFEIYNEPIWDNDSSKSTNWSTWKNAIAQPIVNRIRTTHSANNLILVGSPNWSQVLTPIPSDPVTGGNIVYVAHIYPLHYDNNNSLSNFIGATKDSLPVIMTEWGFQNGAAAPCDSVNEDAYASGMKAYLNTNGISWTGWCFDAWWQPIMFTNWDFQTLNGTSLPSTGGYQGQFLKDFLAETKNANLPGGGTNTATPTPTVTPTPTRTPTATPTITAGLKGDVNNDGQLNILDALLTAQYSAGLKPTNFNTAVADVNCSGTIDILDALRLAQYAAGLLTSLNC